MSWEAWGTPDYMDFVLCKRCHGTGIDEDDLGGRACNVCGGTGEMQEPDDAYFDDDVI